jgi:stress response protein YsnF
MIMKLFEKHVGIQNAMVAISAVALVSGCCGNKGGSYSSSKSAPVYSTTEYSTPAPQPEAKVVAVPAQGKEVVVPLFEETVGKQEVDDGTVRLRKVVKTETVNQPFTIRKEMLVIDRQPAGASATPASQPFQEQEVVVQLKHEEPIVKVVSSGSIVATTKVEETQTNIQHQIRKESIEVDKGNASNVSVSDAVGGTSESSTKVQGRASSGPIMSIDAISSSSDASSLSGQSVQLSDAAVKEVFDDKTFSISSTGGKPVIVHLQEANSEIKAGDMVTLKGTVKTTSAASWTSAGYSEQAWNVAKDQAVYIDAQSVMKK